MSKAKRNREAYLEKQQKKHEREEFAKKTAKVRKITAIITVSLIAALIILLIAGVGIYNHRLNTGEYLRSETAASSKSIDVNGAMMNYYYNDVYNSFVDYYGSYVEYYGLNTLQSAKTQYISDDQTWFDYFMSGAKSNVTGYLAMNEAASADSISLSDDEKTALDNRISFIDTGLYGRGVKSADILDSKLIEALAYKYQAYKQREFQPTSAEITERYANDPRMYQYVDYIYYEFDWSEGQMNRNTVTAYSERLEDAVNLESFKNIVAELLMAEYSDITVETVDSYVESFILTDQAYTEGKELSEWAFSAKSGDTTIITDESTSKTTVYMLISEAARDESKTANVRHILFTKDRWGSTEKAQAKAEEILAEFKSGDMTAEAFAVLALAWTEDENTCYNGGLYENLAEGITLSTFNDWCFFGTRKPGDCDIIETENGIHIVYYDSDGLKNWEADVSDDIITEKFNEFNTTILNDYPVSFDDSLLSQIPG